MSRRAEVAAELEGAGHVKGQSHDVAGCQAIVYRLLVDKVILYGDLMQSR
jgi:hypothetical protein